MEDIPKNPSFYEALTHPALRKSTIFACWLGITNQTTGINLLSIYSSEILSQIGKLPMGVTPSNASVVLIFIGFLGCLAAIPVMKTFSRKTVF